MMPSSDFTSIFPVPRVNSALLEGTITKVLVTSKPSLSLISLNNSFNLSTNSSLLIILPFLIVLLGIVLTPKIFSFSPTVSATTNF